MKPKLRNKTHAHAHTYKKMWMGDYRPCRKHIKFLCSAAALFSISLWMILLVSFSNNSSSLSPLPPTLVPHTAPRQHKQRTTLSSTTNRDGGPQDVIQPNPLQEVISQLPHQGDKPLFVPKEKFDNLMLEWRQIMRQPDERGRRPAPSPCGTKIDPLRAERHLNLSSPLSYDLHFGDLGSSLPDIYVALNLKDAAHLLPSMVLQLTSAMRLVGTQRFFLSIFESDSIDQTVPLLHKWGDLLSDLGVAHFFAHGRDVVRRKEEHRIHFLSTVRNLALEPLRVHQRANFRYDRILFLNDIFFCAADVLELLHQSFQQKADMTCAVDHTYDNNLEEITFYDTWVARDVTGGEFKAQIPSMLQHPESKRLLEQGLPFQVSCCWNGMVVLRAEPFYQHHPASRAEGGELQFRREPTEILFPPDPRYAYVQHHFPREELQVYAQCSASEVNVLCKDMIYLGYSRFMVVPFVRVAYFRTHHYTVRKEMFPLNVPFNPMEDNKVAFVPPPKTMHCIPLDSNRRRTPDGLNGRVFLPQKKDELNAVP
ncbi:GT44 domain-containing protein [Balamuthia mandrillaris]